jgi:hypothetical protein
MHARETRRLSGGPGTRLALLVLGLAGALAGCSGATTQPPPGGLPSAQGSPHDPYGSRALIEPLASSAPDLEGELVAAQDDSLFLFERDTLRVIPAEAVNRVRVVQYEKGRPTTVVFMVGSGEKVRAQDLERLAPYARFPQGLPPDVDRASLRPRPGGG